MRIATILSREGVEYLPKATERLGSIDVLRVTEALCEMLKRQAEIQSITDGSGMIISWEISWLSAKVYYFAYLFGDERGTAVVLYKAGTESVELPIANKPTTFVRDLCQLLVEGKKPAEVQ